MGQERGRKVKIKHGITKESMEEDDMDHIWISLGREDIRKGLIVRDGNLNAIERYGRLGVRWSKFVSTMVGPGGFVVDSILVRRWIIWMCAEGI